MGTKATDGEYIKTPAAQEVGDVSLIAEFAPPCDHIIGFDWGNQNHEIPAGPIHRSQGRASAEDFEPYNFCPECGADLRGIKQVSDTIDTSQSRPT